MAESTSSPSPSAAITHPHRSLSVVMKEAGHKAIGGGVPGAAAMSIQVVSLMWLRTIMNYQYRHGTTMRQATVTLYSQGGIPRFYRGLFPALLQAPLSRFGDVAANAGTLSLLNEYESTRNLPVAVKTMAASTSAAAFRILLMPVDALKTIMQVEGKNGPRMLWSKIRLGGVPVLFHGSIASAAATFVGHYPWFVTFNALNVHLPHAETKLGNYGRNALMGFISSAVSDTVSNSIRVVKTTKQTAAEVISYREAVNIIVKADGLKGLFGRGLTTRLLTNGIQGLAFAVLWKYLEELMFGSHNSGERGGHASTSNCSFSKH